MCIKQNDKQPSWSQSPSLEELHHIDIVHQLMKVRIYGQFESSTVCDDF